MSEHGFVELQPQPGARAFALENVDLDVPASFNLFARPQKAQRVSWIAPESLFLAAPEDLVSIPIKAPGTAVFVPEWAAPCAAFQKIVDHRFATSERAEEEWLHFYYHRSHVAAGECVRLNAGKHFDWEPALDQGDLGRIPVSYMAVSSYPTVFYDGLRNATPDEVREIYRQSREISHGDPEDDLDWRRLRQLRNSYFDSRVYPPEGRCWPAGTITCVSGANIHEAQIVDKPVKRAFFDVTAFEGYSAIQDKPTLRHLNPALAKAYFG